MTRTQNQTARILIVDDEPSIAMAIDFLMQQAGYQTMKVHDGLEALEKIADFNPQLIILDVMMPRMDGHELAREIRAQVDYGEITIIFLTAKGTQKDKMEGYQVGADIYLTKPFDNQELLDTVEEVLTFGL